MTGAVGNIRLGVVVDATQTASCALQELVSFVPDAVLRLGEERPVRHDRFTALIRGMEARFLDLPGQCSRMIVPQADVDDLPEVDLILDLRPGPPDPRLAAKARYGLWTPAEFDTAAVLRGESSMPISLLGIDASGRQPWVVASAELQTKWLPEHTRIFALEKTVQLFRREWARLRLTGVVPDIGPAAVTQTKLGYLQAIRHGIRLGRELTGRKLRPFLTRHHRRPFSIRLGRGEPGQVDLAAARDLALPHKGLRADPFLFEHGGTLYCFYEDFPDDIEEAVIAVARVEGDGLQDLGTVLDTGTHRSYPYVFSHEGAIYMIPEALKSFRVEVWRATEFPMRWELAATALEGQRFADPVVFQHKGEWWFMGSPCHDSLGDFSSELWLFRADGPLLQRLEPHPLNPVVVGSDAGRGAGRVFEHGGRLYRMAQDNTGLHYGYGLRMMEIGTLSMTDYEEHCAHRIRGTEIPGAIGCHHIDFAGGRFVADVRWP